MSKMSNLALELDELAVELGFEDLEDAMNNGYEWVQDDNNEPHLVKIEDEQEKAHEAWLKERDEVLDGLDIVAHSDSVPFEHKEIVKGAIKFIREQCHD